MTNRFTNFNPTERALLMLGLCKIRIPSDSNEIETLNKLIDEVTD